MAVRNVRNAGVGKGESTVSRLPPASNVRCESRHGSDGVKSRANTNIRALRYARDCSYPMLTEEKPRLDSRLIITTDEKCATEILHAQ